MPHVSACLVIDQILRLLKFVLPRSPLHFEVLHRHAFFRIVLLTAQYTVPALTEAEPATSPATGTTHRGHSHTGMLQDAADLIFAFHNVEVQVCARACFTGGWPAVTTLTPHCGTGWKLSEAERSCRCRRHTRRWACLLPRCAAACIDGATAAGQRPHHLRHRLLQRAARCCGRAVVRVHAPPPVRCVEPPAGGGENVGDGRRHRARGWRRGCCGTRWPHVWWAPPGRSPAAGAWPVCHAACGGDRIPRAAS